MKSSPRQSSAKRSAPPAREERVQVLNVNAPRHRYTVDARKYGAVRTALLATLPARSPGLNQAEMVRAATARLPADLFPGGAKATWWIKCVQLDLEARGLVTREVGAKPLRWVRGPRRSEKRA